MVCDPRVVAWCGNVRCTSCVVRQACRNTLTGVLCVQVLHSDTSNAILPNTCLASWRDIGGIYPLPSMLMVGLSVGSGVWGLGCGVWGGGRPGASKMAGVITGGAGLMSLTYWILTHR